MSELYTTENQPLKYQPVCTGLSLQLSSFIVRERIKFFHYSNTDITARAQSWNKWLEIKTL